MVCEPVFGELMTFHTIFGREMCLMQIVPKLEPISLHYAHCLLQSSSSKAFPAQIKLRIWSLFRCEVMLNIDLPLIGCSSARSGQRVLYSRHLVSISITRQSGQPVTEPRHYQVWVACVVLVPWLCDWFSAMLSWFCVANAIDRLYLPETDDDRRCWCGNGFKWWAPSKMTPSNDFFSFSLWRINLFVMWYDRFYKHRKYWWFKQLLNIIRRWHSHRCVGRNENVFIPSFMRFLDVACSACFLQEHFDLWHI